MLPSGGPGAERDPTIVRVLPGDGSLRPFTGVVVTAPHGVRSSGLPRAPGARNYSAHPRDTLALPAAEALVSALREAGVAPLRSVLNRTVERRDADLNRAGGLERVPEFAARVDAALRAAGRRPVLLDAHSFPADDRRFAPPGAAWVPRVALMHLPESRALATALARALSAAGGDDVSLVAASEVNALLMRARAHGGVGVLLEFREGVDSAALRRDARAIAAAVRRWVRVPSRP